MFAAAATPPTQPAPVAPATESEKKDWGPLKPIRPVAKPSEAKSAYILAQTERVVYPEEETKRKRWVIGIGIFAVLAVAGGTLAFVFFGRGASTVPNNANVQFVNSARTNTNTAASVFPNPDADRDGLSDADEAKYGTNPQNIDTDGDGFTDGQEVQGGYNPKGPGKL